MSRIDDLIRQFCPNGVVFERLGDVADFRYGFTASAQDRRRLPVPANYRHQRAGQAVARCEPSTWRHQTKHSTT